jgi:hypothetical protein
MRTVIRTVVLGIFVFAVSFMYGFAHADMVAPNDVGGKIVITDEPCKQHFTNDVTKKYATNGETVKRAYSVYNEGTTAEVKSEGCYLIPDVKMEEVISMEPPPGARAITQVVNIFAEVATPQGKELIIIPHAIEEFSPGTTLLVKGKM